MREIKFRVRTGKPRQEVIGYEAFFDGRWHWKGANDDKWLLDSEGLFKAIGATREEYTGLKDKKRTPEFPEGQEIYEGDIVRAYDDVHTVEYQVDRFDYPAFELWPTPLIDSNALSYCYIEMDDSGLEVIGNIYENPELLK